MATNLYINPDNTIGGLESGKVMVAPTQEEFEECCCEPCEPCDDAKGETTAVVTIIGTCDQTCKDLAGSYVWGAWWVYPPGCYWRWERNRPGVSWDRVTLYASNPFSGSGYWLATVHGDIGGAGFEGVPFNVVLECVGGKLVGSFDVPAWGGCEDCYAHVVLS